MQFSVIYSFEASPELSVNSLKPPGYGKKSCPWTMTECGASELKEWKHRKYTALLSKEEFLEFLKRTCLEFENVPTAGMIGAPGFGLSWLPAFSFVASDYDSVASAYVCPVSDKGQVPGAGSWEMLRKIFLGEFWPQERSEYTFYLEFPSRIARNQAKGSPPENWVHSGNVIAIYLGPYTQNGQVLYEGLSATFFHENSDVSAGGIGQEYLDELCLRIDEETSRGIHPRLFARIDKEEEKKL